MTTGQGYSKTEPKGNAIDVGRPAAYQAHTTVALKTFIQEITAVQKAVILDIGCICDHNIDFFIRRRCRIFVDDLLRFNARIGKQGLDISTALVDELPEDFVYPEDYFDGILCWDVFDYLGANATRALVEKIQRMLKPGSCALALFASENAPSNAAIRYRIASQEELRYELLDLPLRLRNRYRNRDIIKLFRNFTSCNWYLLRNGWREAIVRK